MLSNCGAWRRLLRVNLGRKEMNPVSPKGNQSWILEGLPEAPILWPLDAKSWLFWKDPDAGKDWGQEEKGTTEDEMVGWHHRLGGHGFGWTPGAGDGQGGLACCGSWGRRELDPTERLHCPELTQGPALPSGLLPGAQLGGVKSAHVVVQTPPPSSPERSEALRPLNSNSPAPFPSPWQHPPPHNPTSCV